MRAIVWCPSTDKRYSIEIPLKASDMAKLWKQTISTNCPYCGEAHLDGFKQLYMQSALGVADSTIR